MLANKVIIVTGANKGLGFSIVKRLCENHATVYLTSRDELRGKEACEKLKHLSCKPLFHQLDISNIESVNKFYDFIKEKHGSIDILINNAGILFLKDAKEPYIKQAEETIAVNFFASVEFTERFLQLIKNGGRILNVSSSSGHLSRLPSMELRKILQREELTTDELKSIMNGYLNDVRAGTEINYWGSSPYVVSKVAVNAYTFILNRILKSRAIPVNCVHPGYVMSDMTRGAGNVAPDAAADTVINVLYREGGLYIWHNGEAVPWDGEDPRIYIDSRPRE